MTLLRGRGPGAVSARAEAGIALGIFVATGCDGGIVFPAGSGARHGESRVDIMEIMGMTTHMGNGPRAMPAARACEAFHPFTAKAATTTS